MDKCFSISGDKYLFNSKEYKNIPFEIYETQDESLKKQKTMIAVPMRYDKNGSLTKTIAKRWYKISEKKIEITPALARKNLLYYDKQLASSSNTWAAYTK